MNQQSVFKVGDFCNWKHDPVRLIYLGMGIGPSRNWHQFAKVESPDVVWCEVLQADLHMLEKTAESADDATGSA